MINMYNIIFVRSRYMIVGADSDINISADAHTFFFAIIPQM